MPLFVYVREDDTGSTRTIVQIDNITDGLFHQVIQPRGSRGGVLKIARKSTW
jgi:hypothetical protein